MPSYELVFNASNILPGFSNSRMRLVPGTGVFDLKDCEISLYNLTVNYSFPNITKTTSFSYSWLGTVVPVVFPINQNFTKLQMNQFLQATMVANGHYLIDTAHNNAPIYYASIEANASAYKTQWNAIPIPTALPSGYAVPSTATWSFPVTASIPLLILGTDSGSFAFLTGLPTSGTYPAVTQSNIYSLLGPNTPHIVPFSSVIVQCDCVSEQINQPPTLISSFPINSAYGAPCIVAPFIQKWFKSNRATATYIDIYLTDEFGNALTVLDSFWAGQISIRSAPNPSQKVFLD